MKIYLNKVFLIFGLLFLGIASAQAGTYVPDTAVITPAVTAFTADVGQLRADFTPLLILVTGSLMAFGLFKRFFRSSLS